MLVGLSHDAARVVRTAASLRRLHPTLADTVRHARLIGGRGELRLTPGEATQLRAWCDTQADTWRYADPSTARLLEDASAAIVAAILVDQPQRTRSTPPQPQPHIRLALGTTAAGVRSVRSI